MIIQLNAGQMVWLVNEFRAHATYKKNMDSEFNRRTTIDMKSPTEISGTYEICDPDRMSWVDELALKASKTDVEIIDIDAAK